MPRPKNKTELLNLSKENYKEMFTLINSFEENERKHGEIPFEDRDRNIRDILAHLHHWHLMFLDWYDIGMKGEKPEMPSVGYTWKTTALLNENIKNKYQKYSYDEVEIMINESYEKVQKIINLHSQDELFEKKRYKWTGSTSLGSYLVSATSSHYDWAIKKIKKYKKSLK